MTSDYAGYSEWKQWAPSQFMVRGPYERRYYKGELGGLGGTELLAEARARRNAARGSICRTFRMR